MQAEPDCSYPDQDPSFRVPDCIPVFPLPNVVFFPKTFLPLHIFEPRYRDMTRDASAEGRCIGMALLKEGWENDYYGNPPIFEVGCVGHLVSVHHLPDGRSNIVLQGVSRYQIRQQSFDRSYRQAMVASMPSLTPSTLAESVRRELMRLLESYLRMHDLGQQWRQLLSLELDDETLVNHVSASLDFTPLEKQFLLEAETLLQHARRLIDLLQFKMHERDGARGYG